MGENLSLYQKTVNFLQGQYSTHRAPELAGTPPVSQDFFDLMRKYGPLFGPLSAGIYLVEREKELGSQHLPPTMKAVIQLIGSSFLASGIGADNQRHSVPKLLRNAAVAMLFSAQAPQVTQVDSEIFNNDLPRHPNHVSERGRYSLPRHS